MEDSASTQIYRELRDRIVTGALAPGDRIPSARQIKKQWGVAIATATKALARLQQDGLVSATRGVGTTVVAKKAVPRPTSGAAAHALGVDRIVACATAIADHQGIAALSMRSIASELGVATMSLYRHVPSRDALIDLMIDAAYGEVRLPPAPPGDWRARLALFARGQWQLYVRHPWLPHAMSITRPQLTPNGMAHTEWAMTALDGTGLDLAAQIRVAIACTAHARAHALDLELERHATLDSGMTPDEWFAAQAETLHAITTTRELPLLARVAAAPDIALDPETVFMFGLECLLDGVAVLIDRGRSASGRRRPQPGHP